MMKAVHYQEIAPTRFDSGPVKGVSGRVAIGKNDGAAHFCMRVFEIEPGGFTPRHRHEWEHEIFVHGGRGEVFNNGSWQPITAGFTVFIPGDAEHQIRNVGDGPLVFVCLIPSGPPEL